MDSLICNSEVQSFLGEIVGFGNEPKDAWEWKLQKTVKY